MANESVTQGNVAQKDGIEHVVLLLLENHSFDQMLGSLQQVIPDLDGVTAVLASTRKNLTCDGVPVHQHETTERQMKFDPKHEHVNVLRQLEGGNGGFVKDFQTAYGKQLSADDVQDIMGYYPLDFLPALHPLGREFTICDNWFSSLPGPTWPNRFFALSGTSSGEVFMPSGLQGFEPHWYTEQSQPTIFSRMTEKGLAWRVYHYDFPASLLLTQQRRPENLAHYASIDQFFKDAAGAESAFPAFTLIEPQYFGVGQNDDHPPHNVMKAEKLIADVYNAVRSNPPLWERTLLVVLYDEHGGFYDHVTPPATIPPDEKVDQYGFNQLGVRVPALLVSPHCAQRVEHTQFDHTSLLKYLQEKWQLGPLGERVASDKTNSIGCAIGTVKSPREDTIPFIRVSNQDLISDDVEIEKDATNANLKGLHAFADYLHQEMDNGMQRGVDTSAEIAGWVGFKHLVGRLLVKWGMSMSHDMRTVQQLRLERTRNAVGRLKKTAVATK